MNITQFTISGYKSFGNEKRINSIKKLNLIYGENNSGKSNLLKFLSLIFTSKKSNEKLEVEGEIIDQSSPSYFFEGLIDDKPYIYHKNQRDNIIEFEFTILIDKDELENAGFEFFETLKENYFEHNGHREIPINFKGYIHSVDKRSLSEIKLYDVNFSGNPVLTIDQGTERFFSHASNTDLEGNKIYFQQFMSLFNNLVTYIDNERFFGQEQFNLRHTNITSKNFKNWLHNLYLDEFENKKYLNFKKFTKGNSFDSLKPLKDLEISFSINENEKLELFLHNGSERLPIDSFGTSLTQILYILAYIFMTNSKVILIEEIELNLSIKTQEQLFQILKDLIDEREIEQVFFTSHSDFFKFRNDYFSVYEISINNEGSSSIKRKNKLRKSPFSN